MNRLARFAFVAVVGLTSRAWADKPDAGKPALTPAAWKKLNLSLHDCKLVGYDIDGRCPAVLELQEALKNTSTGWNEIVAMNAAAGRELLAHPSPAVRVRAAHLLSSVMSTETQDAIVATGAKETDPGVMQAFIRTLASSGAKNPKVAAFLIKAGDHPDVKVRQQAVYALGSGWNREMKGGAEKLLAMAEKDKEASVRQDACEYGGELGNKIFLPLMEKGTAKTADKDLYTSCMTGLVKMFHSWPHYETSNEGAYALFLTRLSEKPRTAERPPWTVTNAFQHANEERNERLADWLKASPWWKPVEVKKVLTDLVQDKSSNWMARKGAIASLVGLGATKAELVALIAGYDEKNNEDKMVLKALEQAVAKAK